MSDDAKDTGELLLLDPAQMRAAQELKVDIGGGRFVLARKLDMTAMVFEGLLPMPLLAAVQRMIDSPDLDPLERVAAMTADDSAKSMLNLLRRHAIVAVTSPKLVEIDTGDPTTLPVTMLALDQLMAIWTATAVVPMAEPIKAARFRGRPRAVPPPDAQPRKDLLTSAEPVVVAVAEVKHA